MILEDAEKIAVNNGMKFLESLVKRELLAFENNFKRWNQLISENSKLSDKFELSDCHEYLQLIHKPFNL